MIFLGRNGQQSSVGNAAFSLAVRAVESELVDWQATITQQKNRAITGNTLMHLA